MPRASATLFLLGPCVLLSAAFVPGRQAPRAPSAKTPHSASAKKPNYAEHVAPVLNRSCVPCHRPGQVAPFSLVGYENARKWAPMVAAVTEARRMPPWKAVHGYGEFLDENRLSQAEISMRGAWAKAGSPRGDRRKEPKPPSFASAWPLGEPDLVLSPKREYRLDAEGEDVYRNFVMDYEVKEPMWVRAMAIQPGNPKVVHHVITFLDSGGASLKLLQANRDGQEGYTSPAGGVGFLPSGSLGGWAPGLNARYTPDEAAFLVKPGTRFVVQVHYHKTGKPEKDLTKVGLYLAKSPPKKEMLLDWIFDFRLRIPPGEKAHKVSRVRRVPVDVTLYGAMPHMHLLGRSMKAWVEYPDGKTRPMVWVDDWDFNWQLSYAFKRPMKVPKGSKIHVEAVYDNSAENPRNPHNPPRLVTFGEQTTDEMFLMILAYTVDGDGRMGMGAPGR